MILQHQSKQFALGLTWASAHDAAEARRESQSRPRAHRVLLPSNGQFWIGLYDEPVKGVSYAAALAVGLIDPNVIICERVSETHSWLCAIVEGLPVVGYDHLVVNEEARDTVSQWTSFFPKAQFVGADLPGAKSSLSEVLDELAKAIATKRITPKQLVAIRLRRQGISLTSVVAAVGILSLPILGYAGWVSWNKILASSSAQKVSMANAAKQALNAEQAAAEKRKKIAQFGLQVAAKRADLDRQSATHPEPLWRQWHSKRKLPLVAYGYQPSSMNCDASSCTLQWVGSGAFTLPADKLRLPSVVPNMEPTLSATSIFPLTPTTMTRSGATPFLTPESLRFAFANAASVALPALQIEAMTPVVLSPPQELGLAPVHVGAIGKWSLALNGPMALVSAEDAFSFLKPWPVQLTSIKFETLGATAGGITVEGTYIHNRQQP